MCFPNSNAFFGLNILLTIAMKGINKMISPFARSEDLLSYILAISAVEIFLVDDIYRTLSITLIPSKFSLKNHFEGDLNKSVSDKNIKNMMLEITKI